MIDRRRLTGLLGFVVLSPISALAQSAPAKPAQPATKPSPAAAAATPTDPKSFVEGLYKKISAGKGETGGQQFWLDPKGRPKTFSKSLVAAWKKAEAQVPKGEAGPLDFDPFTASQDPRVKKVLVRLVSSEGSRAEVEVKVYSPEALQADEPVVLTISLVDEAGAWKIDDMVDHSPSNGWRLRDFMGG